MLANREKSIFSTADIENYSELSVEKKEVIQEALIEFTEEVWYKSKPLGEFAIGAVAQWLLIQGEDVRTALEFLFPSLFSGWTGDTETFFDSIDSKGFQLGRTAGNLTAIISGIVEMAIGTGAQATGSGLCFTGIGCLAGAPAIATGFLLQAHGLGVIKNAGEELAEDVRDLLTPNRMESRGGADDIAGLAREIGVSQERIENGIEVLGKDKIKHLKDRLVYKGKFFERNELGELVEVERDVNLLKPLLDKSQDLIKNVSKTLGIVGNDADAISDVRETLRQNKVKPDGTRLIDDNQLNTAFSNSFNFLEQYGNRVSGAFTNRFGRASTSRLDDVQALGEIRGAEDVLDGRALQNDGVSLLGDIREIAGIPDRNLRPGLKNPDYLITDSNGSTRFFEIKTPDGNIDGRRNIKKNLRTAIEQIIRRSQATPTTDKAFLRLDYASQSSATSTQTRNQIFGKVKRRLEFTDEELNVKGVDYIEYVEVFYKNGNNGGQIETLLIQVQNGNAVLLN